MYSVIKDSREKSGGWFFPAGTNCEGTSVAALKTGDYTLRGFEETFVIERKASTSEIAQNLFQDRFERELERLEDFKHPFVVCEFTWDQLMKFPQDSGIPKFKWTGLRVSSYLLVKRLLECQLRYKARFLLCGQRAYEVASSLFKRITEAQPL